MRRVISAFLTTALLLALATAATAQDGADRAQQLIEQARAALGGEKIKSIQSLSVSGKYRRILQADMPEMAGEIEIDFLLPDKYVKTETMNMPAGDGYITRIDGINGDQPFRDTRTTGGGMVMIRRPGAEGPDGQAAETRSLRAEFARNLLSFILAVPPSFPLEFSYVGEAEAEDGRAEVIDVKGADGFAARLFLDKQSHRPLMLSYRARQPRIGMMTRRIDGANREEAEKKAREAAEKHAQEQPQEEKEVEVQVFFSEYRLVDGVSLPHQISRSIDGKVSEEWELKKFKINPPLKAERFKK